jgi:hypothetical protein
LATRRGDVAAAHRGGARDRVFFAAGRLGALRAKASIIARRPSSNVASQCSLLKYGAADINARLGVVGGTLVGWLTLSFLSYLYHRTSHTWSPLWRISHQIHHSPQQVDISGSVLFHPFEMVVQVLLQLFVTVLVLGLDPLAAALTGVVAALHGIFQRWNVRTPRWIGYFVQRPAFGGQCGFDAPADRRLGAMLVWQDVNEPVLGSRSRGAGSFART